MCKGIDHEPRKIGGPADCLKSPLLCVSGISGSERKRRVEGIMMNRSAHDLNFGRRLLLAIAGFTAVALPLAAGAFHIPTVLRLVLWLALGI